VFASLSSLLLECWRFESISTATSLEPWYVSFMVGNDLQTQLRAWTRPRPIRVAYLVEDHEHSRPLLDAVFAHCHSRWGGRFSLVVPCSKGLLHDAYANWLHVFDPDVIYSYIHLEHTTVEYLHERYYPSVLIKHDFGIRKERDTHSFRPRLPLDTLTSVSVVPNRVREDYFQRGSIGLLNSWFDHYGDGFFEDSFGFYSTSFGRAFPSAGLSTIMRSIILVPPHIREDRRIHKPDGEVFTEEISLLGRIAQSNDIYGMAQLSASSSPRLEIRKFRWSGAFNIIVGESFADRIIFFNSGFFTPSWLHAAICTLRVPLARFEDQDFVAGLAELLRNRNHVQEGSSAPIVTLRSTSVPRESLELIREKLQAHRSANLYMVESPITVEEFVPTTEELKKARRLAEPKVFESSAAWSEDRFSSPSFRPFKRYPGHLRDFQTVPPEARTGAWAIDLDAERPTNHRSFAAVGRRWRLPRRLRMAKMFQRSHEDGGIERSWSIPRVTIEGLLTIYVSHDVNVPEITLPNDDDAIDYALHRGVDWPAPDGSRERCRSTRSTYVWSRLSDKGRYLTGTLHLFKNFEHAANVLLHSFWLDEFRSLGASHAMSGRSQVEPIVRKLQRRLNANKQPIYISADDDWERLATVVLAVARDVRLPNRSVSFGELKERWDKFRREQMTEVPPPDDEASLYEAESLPYSVQALCQNNVLFQGHQWRCFRCYHKNWISISSLHKEIACEVCHRVEPAPVELEWRFRLNEFLIEGVKEHGVLALVWCLNKLARRARESFLFSAPRSLYSDFPDKAGVSAEAEIDLICVVDGKVHMCEVKPRLGTLKPTH
jgi:hypothetical protein